MTNIKKFFGGVLLASLLGLVSCSGGSGSSAQDQKAGNKNEQTAQTAKGTADPEKPVIKFGTTVGDFGDMVKESIKGILEKEGYKVELTEFTDYVQPNKALANGDIDVNIFQHKPYLDDFAKTNHLDLTPLFQVPTAPLGIYSGKSKKLDDVKDGSVISIPNDPSNLARALVMMDQLGWIKLKPNIDPLTASIKDIAEYKYKIKFKELEAAQLPRSREDVDFAVINGNYAVSSGVDLTTALYQEPSFAYINWGVFRTADKDKKWVKDVVAAYNSKEFKDYCYKKFPGYKYPLDWGPQPGQKGEAKADAKADQKPEAKPEAKAEDKKEEKK